jgi:excinuclease ABC subunit C
LNLEEIKASISDFPDSPGVYIMKDETGQIIYVGKAKKLRARVRSYFLTGRDVKTAALVKRIRAIDFVVTANEYEALILENNLIKQHSPRYNINLKDGKTYPVIRITKDEYPRIFRTRRIIRDGSDYFGPFADVKAIDIYLEVVDTLFPLRKCKGKLKKRDHPCLYYHIGKCPGPCAGLISKEDYQKRADDIRELLSEPPVHIKEDLRRRMQSASEKLEFEQAAELRDRLQAVETIASDQLVNDFDPESRDYIACHEHEGLISFVVFQMRQGRLVGTDIFRSRSFSAGEARDDLEQFIIRYYQEFRRRPSRIFLRPGEADENSLERFFAEQIDDTDRENKDSVPPSPDTTSIRVSAPETGRDRSLLNMAYENARQDSFKRAREIGDEEGIAELQKVFRLPKLPRRIEGFDIAQLHGKFTVAAMVSFHNGVPDKKEYRYFNIKSLKGKIDDYESMREAMARRYSRLINEKKALPDLILIDGGKGQLSAAMGILEFLGLRGQPILALAKQDEEVFLPGRGLGVQLPEGTPGLRVLQAVRDEAHRFGTTLNQKQRNQDLELQVKDVQGFGPRRSQQLLAEFTSYEEAVDAGAREIHQRTGIPLQVAENFIEYFTKSDSE